MAELAQFTRSAATGAAIDPTVAHRLFLDLRNSMSSDDVAVVDQVEAGEDHIKRKFEDAIRDTDISPAVKAIIEDAYAIVKDGPR